MGGSHEGTSRRDPLECACLKVARNGLGIIFRSFAFYYSYTNNAAKKTFIITLLRF